MKGPRSRHKFFIARAWECPACQKRAHVPVQIVNRACYCQGADQPTWMRLIDDPNERVPKANSGAPLPTVKEDEITSR